MQWAPSLDGRLPEELSHGRQREARIQAIAVTSIRRDGGTQHRVRLNEGLVREYAALMNEGTAFPPIRVWWDGGQYWLTDGFHRLAAAEKAGRLEILADIRDGSKLDAQWDSYAANSEHGLRWTPAETRAVIHEALAHPHANTLSNVELAKHLHLSEHTIRRWRKTMTFGSDDNIRIVRRGNSSYRLATDNIGRRRQALSLKSRKILRTQLTTMKLQGSPKVRRLLTVIGNWAFGATSPGDCVSALERIIED